MLDNPISTINQYKYFADLCQSSQIINSKHIIVDLLDDLFALT